MTDQQQHPITPPPELVEKWRNLPEYTDGRRKIVMVTVSREKLLDIATQAARWGSDQELKACCEWVSQFNYDDYNYQERLRAARRRSKPPSLKEQALDSWDRLKNEAWCEEIDFDLHLIRRALESLPS